MPYDEDERVFDVSKPSKVAPSATSKPVIVGHQPSFNDPMVRDESRPSTPISITVDDGSGDKGEEPHSSPEPGTSFEPQPEDTPYVPEEVPAPVPAEESSKSSESSSHPGFTSLHSLIGSGDDAKEKDDGPKKDVPAVSGSSPVNEPPPFHTPAGAGPRRKLSKALKWLLIIILIVIIAGYLAIDAGLIKSNMKLPFHIFNKQKTTNTAATAPPSTPAPAPQPTGPTVPADFTAYQLSGTGVSFDYPTAWGQPKVTTDPGFSQRGGTNKSDGVYAYLVNFSSNKNVQIALTSSKSLPATRSPLYYDYLQWCVGTNDGKFYKQSMHFTTANKVDTPSTVACDQGPLTDASKLDDQTIVQLKTKDANGKTVLGDLYTLNLNSETLPVLRVKDAAMTNGTDIKTLLGTVQASSTSSSTNQQTP